MKITFLGATRMVTGSCYLLEIGSKKMLLDCGMFQGSKMITAFNEKDFVFALGITGILPGWSAEPELSLIHI